MAIYLARIRRRRLPALRLRRFAFILLALAASASHSLDLRISGKPWPLPEDSALRALCYPVPEAGPGERGIALSEVLPPLAEAWKLDAKGPGGNLSWASDEVLSLLGETYLLASKAGWKILCPRGVLDGISSIDLSAQAAEEGELEVWLSWEGVPKLKAELARWSALTGVKVKALELPDTRSKFLALLRGGGRLPDLFMVQTSDIADLSETGALQRLERLAGRASPLDPKGLQAFRTERGLWALPFYFDTQLVFYRKSKLRKAPAETWSLEGLEALAVSLSAPGKPALSWNMYSAYWLLPFAIGFGKLSIADADGAVRPDDPGTLAALEWMLGLIGKGALEPLERDAMIGRFASGEIPIILSGSYSIPEFERIGIDFGVASYPVSEKTGKAVSPLLDYKGFAVSKSTKSPISAAWLLGYLTGTGVQQRFNSALYKLPVEPGAWAEARRTNPYYPQLARSAAMGSVIPPGEGYSIYKNVMWKIIRFVLTGAMTLPKALGEARRLIDANYSQKH
ncbi:MAG TPA: extracellular solute-binding protein [Rectinemataceae bacterium]